LLAFRWLRIPGLFKKLFHFSSISLSHNELKAQRLASV